MSKTMSNVKTATGDNRPPAALAPVQKDSLVGFKMDLLLLALLWLLSLVFVNPIGDFPLNDDWSFAKTVKGLLDTGTYRPGQWSGMTLIAHALWGALFCLPAGFSFNALRLSTLVMSVCGMIVTYLSLRQVHPSRLLAVIAALTVAFNPLYYALSNTFMTDITFSALLITGALLLGRDLNNGTNLNLIAGTFFVVAATLCRQLGLAVPIAYALCLIWTRGLRTQRFLRAVIPLACCAAALTLFQYWLNRGGRLPAYYAQKPHLLFTGLVHLNKLLPSLAKHIGIGALYLGWFALPVTLVVLPMRTAALKEPRVFFPSLCAGVLFVLFAASGLVLSKLKMPTTGNVLIEQGIGPLTLSDAYGAKVPPVASLGKAFWLGATAASLLGGGLLLAYAVAAALRAWPNRKNLTRIRPDQVPGPFFFLCALVYLFPVVALGGWDRYYLPALPLLLVAAGSLASSWDHSAPRARLGLSALALALLTLLAVGGTHDYLAWNRARWTALNDFLAAGKATPKDIDGGFEFNGWYLFDPTYQEQPGKTFWWVYGDSYQIAFSQRVGWKTVREYSFSHWLPPYTGKIRLLEKEGPQAKEELVNIALQTPMGSERPLH